MVIWADPAKFDLRAIHVFIASDSKYYAKKVVQDIMDRTNILKEYPRSGRKVPEIDDENIREIFMYSYRIIYEIKLEKVYIIAIIHGRRDFRSTHAYSVKETSWAGDDFQKSSNIREKRFISPGGLSNPKGATNES
jgi:toxin ParE1/3/4